MIYSEKIFSFALEGLENFNLLLSGCFIYFDLMDFLSHCVSCDNLLILEAFHRGSECDLSGCLWPCQTRPLGSTVFSSKICRFFHVNNLTFQFLVSRFMSKQ